MGAFQQSKDIVRSYFQKLEKCTPEEVTAVLHEFMEPNFKWEGSFPFMYQTGCEAVASTFWVPLKESLQFMQRRQDIFMAGIGDEDQKTWVMSMGQFMGLFDKDFLGIRRTRKIQHLQYFEFNCIENNKIIRSVIFVDLLGFMKEAGQYPLPPETGQYFVYSGPRDHNGLHFEDDTNPLRAQQKASASMELVVKMSEDLESLSGTNMHPADSLRKTWAADMIWYGPCGVGASYTIPRYQEQHQIPFRECNNNIVGAGEIGSYFAEGDFVCFFTHMALTPTGGWLGMTGTNQSVFLHADLDVYYCKDGLISENWCFFDIPHWLSLQGVNIFERTVKIYNP